MGRYDDDPSPDVQHTVELLGVPVRVMLAARDRHDELMREFALLALGGGPTRHMPARLTQLIEILGVRFGAAAARPDQVVEQAAERGLDTVDLSYVVPSHVVRAADTLDALMAEADEFCRAEQLLTLARDGVLLDFSDWYLGEFRRQVAGEPPARWTGPLDP